MKETVDLPNFRDPETNIVHAAHSQTRLYRGHLVTECEYDDRNHEFVEALPEGLKMTRAPITCLRCLCAR